MTLDTVDTGNTSVRPWMGRIPMSEIVASPKLVVALDKPTAAEARALVAELGSLVEVYKVGLELLFGGGLDVAHELKSQSKLVFLDMKLLDIPNTVEKAVANIARLGFDFVTVHAVDKKTVAAAVRGRNHGDLRPKEKRLKLLGVTVHTSSTQRDLIEQGIQEASTELAVRRARLCFEVEFDGVIASGFDARAIRAATSKEFIIKVPGIRPKGFAKVAKEDQSRVMTPTAALREGADYLVVGRPIADAEKPVIAVRRIIEEIHSFKG